MTPEPDDIRVDVVYALPDRYWQASLRLAADATVADALAIIEGRSEFREWFAHRAGLAIFGRSAGEGSVLRDGDRLELLRPLQADPKQARRQRAGR